MTRWLVNAAIVVATVAATEVLAHVVHRRVMHGWGWGWHRSHHEPRTGWLERNDWYALIFAAVAVVLMLLDAQTFGPMYWIGVGMTLYGALYFFVHDIVTHRRWRMRGSGRSAGPRNAYLKRLVQAHRMHHAVRGRDGGVSFGFLYAPPVRVLKARLAVSAHSPTVRPSTRHEPHARQTVVGVGLAAAILVTWLALHVWGVFFHPLTGLGLAAAPLLVAVLTWLDVGLFIVAHDCMHGSLAPGRPGINRVIGRMALVLYAGFSFDKLLSKHHAHHRHSGTAADPDFDPSGPHRFWTWYGRFFREYFGWREFLILAVVPWAYVLVLGASWPSLLMFWALPAILSSLQLFAFGTYLPHRHSAVGFTDRHNARSSDYGWLRSLLTCFHFGYHHEHHLQPGVPWWRLPRTRLPR